MLRQALNSHPSSLTSLLLDLEIVLRLQEVIKLLEGMLVPRRRLEKRTRNVAAVPAILRLRQNEVAVRARRLLLRIVGAVAEHVVHRAQRKRRHLNLVNVARQRHMLIVFVHVLETIHFWINMLIERGKSRFIRLKHLLDSLVLLRRHHALDLRQLLLQQDAVEVEADTLRVNAEEVLVEELGSRRNVPRRGVQASSIQGHLVAPLTK